MTRKQFVQAVAKDSKVAFADVSYVLKAMERVIIKTIGEGEPIKMFAGFIIEPVYHEEKEMYIVGSGKWGIVPEHYTCRLLTKTTFKRKLNGKNK